MYVKYEIGKYYILLLKFICRVRIWRMKDVAESVAQVLFADLYVLDVIS